jgi:hypothetical protein
MLVAFEQRLLIENRFGYKYEHHYDKIYAIEFI